MVEESPDRVRTGRRQPESPSYGHANYMFVGAVAGFLGGIVGSYALGACEAYNRGVSLAGCAANGAAFAVLLFHPATWIGAVAGAALGGLAYLVKRRVGKKTPAGRES
jgi:hypothetical protein